MKCFEGIISREQFKETKRGVVRGNYFDDLLLLLFGKHFDGAFWCSFSRIDC